jgi:3-polyprenyl-4-hydroxybenzoate decarboxylase
LNIDDFEALASFYGAPTKMAKCQANVVPVPASGQLVLEREHMVTGGLAYEQGAYAAYTGTLATTIASR